MPAWSPEIANELIRLAVADRQPLDQIQLQKLVYIAHGWCLAVHGQPLTGDRPEAWEFGPVYRRLANALASYGRDPVTQEIRSHETRPDRSNSDPDGPVQSDLEDFERDLIAHVYQDYRGLQAPALSSLTRRTGAPWKEVFADGAGKFREIPHNLIEAQFVGIAGQAQTPKRP